jgi:hypothetical protein
MDQFEKQFEQQFSSSSEPQLTMTSSVSATADPPPQAYAMPGSRFAPQLTPTAPAPAPAPTQVQVQSPPVPASTAPDPNDPAAVVESSKPSVTELAFAASTATADVTRGRRHRKRVLSAVRGIVAGLIFIVVGVVLIFLATAQNNPPAGQLKANGIVTSLGHAKVGCAPVARFAAAGGSYTTAKSAAISPCPVQLGQSVNVFYTFEHPGTTGLISTASSISTIDWAITGIGVLLLIGSTIVFFVRAGSVANGVAAVRANDERQLAASPNRP